MMMSAGTTLALGVIVFTGCRDGETAADADGLGAWVSGQAMRDVFLIPKVNGRKDPNISAAKAENWKIERIVSDSKSFADIKGIKIYCPTRIEFRKKDGKPHVSEFPARENCADDINTSIGSVTYK